MSEDFGATIERWAKKTHDRLEAAPRAISLEIMRRLIRRTPVDTGRARGNWQISLDHAANKIVGPEWKAVKNKNGSNKRGAFPIRAGEAMAAGLSTLGSFKLGESIFITNHLPYINRLEHGWSKQAANGMVSVTLTEFPGIVRDTTARIAALQASFDSILSAQEDSF
jgi:hypothetical protein